MFRVSKVSRFLKIYLTCHFWNRNSALRLQQSISFFFVKIANFKRQDFKARKKNYFSVIHACEDDHDSNMCKLERAIKNDFILMK